MKQFCDEEQKQILDRVIWLNFNTTIGWGEQDATSKEMDEYCPSCGARMNGRNKGDIFPLCFGYYDIHSNCCKYRCPYNDCCKEDYIERIRIN